MILDVFVVGSVIVLVTIDVDVLVTSTSVDIRIVLDIEVVVVSDIVAVNTVESAVTLVKCVIDLVGVDVTVTMEAMYLLQKG
jgi:hypothetical protein